MTWVSQPLLLLGRRPAGETQGDVGNATLTGYTGQGCRLPLQPLQERCVCGKRSLGLWSWPNLRQIPGGSEDSWAVGGMGTRPDQEGRKGSEEGVPENLRVPLEGDRDFRELCGSHQG